MTSVCRSMNGKVRIARRGLYHYNCVSVFRIKVTISYEVC